MKIKLKAVFLASMMLAVLPMLASADTILYQHPFDSSDSSAWCSPCFGDYRMWDVFDLATASTVTGVQARVYNHFENYPAPIEFSIWTANRGTQLFSQSFLWSELSVTPVNISAYDVTAILPSLDLTAGSYSLSIVGLGSSGEFGWYQTVVTVDGRSFQSDTGGGSGSGRDMQFRVFGTEVPAPATLSLFGLALAGLGYSRRKGIAS